MTPGKCMRENPTRNKCLVENLGKVYTRTLFGSQPVHPPAGDDQTSADDKAPTYIYIYIHIICIYIHIICIYADTKKYIAI